MTKRKAAISSLNKNKAQEDQAAYYLSVIAAELGLGEAVREYKFAKPIKRQFQADMYFAPNLLLEIEGGVHSNGRHVRAAGYEKDCEKYSIAAALGYYVLRFTYTQIYDKTAESIMKLFADRAICVRECAKQTQAPSRGGQGD